MIDYSREGWRPDPDGVHQYRYHDGRAWTDRVGNDGVESWSPRAAVPPAPPPSPSAPLDQAPASRPAIDGAVAGALAHQYGAACSAVLAAAQEALDVANEAKGAWRMAQTRPQHEISIRNFTDLFHEREAALGHLVGALKGAVTTARDLGAALATCEGLDDPEMWLLVCLENDVYGQVAVAIEFLRVEIGPGVAGFLETIDAVNEAVTNNPNYGESGFLGLVYGARPRGSGDPAQGAQRNPNAF